MRVKNKKNFQEGSGREDVEKKKLLVIKKKLMVRNLMKRKEGKTEIRFHILKNIRRIRNAFFPLFIRIIGR